MCTQFVACFVSEAFRECRVKVVAYVVSATESFTYRVEIRGGGAMEMKSLSPCEPPTV